jgi:hypothetical protein
MMHHATGSRGRPLAYEPVLFCNRQAVTREERKEETSEAGYKKTERRKEMKEGRKDGLLKHCRLGTNGFLWLILR